MQAILELARQAQDLSRLKQSAQNTQGELEDLKKTDDLLSTLLDSVIRLCESLAVLYTIMDNLTLQQLSNDILYLVRLLEESKQEFEETPNQSDKLKRLENKIKSLQPKVADAWRKHINQLWEGYKDVCSTILSLKLDRWQEVKKVQEEIHTLKRKSEFTRNDLNSLHQAFERLNEYTRNVSLPESVQEFLQKVIAGTATLDDLDLQKIQWLEEQGLLSKFKVTIRHDDTR